MSKKGQKDEPEFFVSRRGRKVGVHEVDLSGINIDSDDTAAATTPDTVRQKPAKKRDSSVAVGPGLGTRKKRLLIAALLLVLIIVPLLAAELVAQQYRDGSVSAKQDLRTLVSNEVLPAQKKATVSADQLRRFAGNVNDIVGHMCRGGLLDNAAQLYPRAKSALTDCKDAQSDYAALTSRLYDLEAQARYLEKLGAQIKPVTAPITDEYAVINAQQSAWQQAAEGVKKLSPPDEMKSAHAELAVHIAAVAEAWSKLNTANNQQDAAAFTEAEKTLSTEYEAVRGTSAQLQGVLSDTQARLTVAYDALK